VSKKELVLSPQIGGLKEKCGTKSATETGVCKAGIIKAEMWRRQFKLSGERLCEDHFVIGIDLFPIAMYWFS
jgi:hypothetical protein